jgi:hypothetical protein
MTAVNDPEDAKCSSQNASNPLGKSFFAAGGVGVSVHRPRIRHVSGQQFARELISD